MSGSSKRQLYEGLLTPFPVALRATKSKGRHIVARPMPSSSTTAADALIPAGTPILRERPCAFVLFKQHADTFCHTCLARFSRRRSPASDGSPAPAPTGGMFTAAAHTDEFDCIVCTGCRKQTYWCSEPCRQAAAAAHALICDALVQLPGIAGMHCVDAGLVRLIMTVLVNSEIETAAAGISDGSDGVDGSAVRTPMRCIDDLLSHYSDAQPRWIEAVTHAAVDIVDVLGKVVSRPLSVDDVVKLACRINSNSHGVYDPAGTVNGEIGVGMFPLVAMLNHSCAPNCAFVTGDGGQMLVHTLRDVAAGDELCVSYVDLFAPTWERRGKLLTTKFFWCECSRCVGGPLSREYELDGLLCLSCGVAPLLPRVDGGHGSRDSQSYYCGSHDGVTIESPSAAHQLSCAQSNTHAPDVTAEQHTAIQHACQRDMDASADLLSIGEFRSGRIALDSALAKCRASLHPSHHLFLSLHISLSNVCSKLSAFAPALAQCSAALAHMRHLTTTLGIPHNLPDVSDLLEKRGQLLQVVSVAVRDGLIDPLDADVMSLGLDLDPDVLDASARDALDECADIRRICYGASHPKTLAVRDM
ncbi:hypothetical protein BC831DRAFT_513726 [Entophlyctis helioformis]|nr:hypothetical protein BC831DRAFT_513726 [Entophlyctis helioformis]